MSYTITKESIRTRPKEEQDETEDAQKSYLSPDPDEVLPEVEPEVELEPWNPSSHDFLPRVLKYLPNHSLVYEIAPPPMDIGFLLISSALLGWGVGLYFQKGIFGLFICFAIASGIGLIRWKSTANQVVRWEWDFVHQELQKAVGDKFETYDLQQVTDIELQVTEIEKNWSSSLSGQWQKHHFYQYNAQVSLKGISEQPTLHIASTRDVHERQEEAEYHGLIFANMLSQAIGKPVQIVHPQKG